MVTDTLEKKAAGEMTEANGTSNRPRFCPRADILERADEITVYLDMPGVSREGVDVGFEDGTLTIQGRMDAPESANRRVLLREFVVGDYFRQFSIGDEIDAERIAADFGNGVLTLHLPKVAAVQPRKIEVSAAT